MIKKASIILLTIFFLFTVSLDVHADSEEQIRKDLEKVKVRIYDLLEKAERMLEGDKVKVDFPEIPTDFRFRNHLRFRDYVVPDVKYLQIILNADPKTRLIESGVGSPGNEVYRFGNLTKNAVEKFQTKYKEEILYPWGITQPTGIVEIQTVKKLNKILEGEIIIEVFDPEKRREIREELIAIILEIQDLRRRLDNLSDNGGTTDASLSCYSSTKNSINFSYDVKGANNAALFKGSSRLTTLGSGDRSGTYIDTGLSPDTTYTYYLRDGTTSSSTELARVSCKTDSEDIIIPDGDGDAPQNLKAAIIAYGEVRLIWDGDDDVDFFVGYKGIKSGGPYEEVGITKKKSGIVTGLEGGRRHYFVVTQEIDGKESGYSNEASVYMDYDPAPFNVKTEVEDIGQLRLTWETDQSNISEYRIYRSTNHGGPYSFIGTSKTRSFVDTPGLYTVYHYVVTQVIGGKESDYSGERVDSWFYNSQGGSYPHPEKEAILDKLDYN